MLTDRKIPFIYPDQLDLITYDKMHVDKLGVFDPARVVAELKSSLGKRVYAVDIGGDKLAGQEFEVNGEGQVQPLRNQTLELKVKNEDSYGANFIDALEQIASYANRKQLAVGISYGAPIKDSKPTENHKFSSLINHLDTKHSGSFRNLFHKFGGAINDGPAGLIAGSIEAYKRYGSTEAIYLINGGGIGLALLSHGNIYATETGHSPLSKELNKYQIDEPCGLFGANWTCLQSAGSNGGGVENIWYSKTAQKLDGKQIEDHWRASGEHAQLVEDLYDYSALVVAHAAIGAANAFKINLSKQANLAIIGSGGAFRFPGYTERLTQIIGKFVDSEPKLFSTYEFSPNACLQGAAINAITQN